MNRRLQSGAHSVTLAPGEGFCGSARPPAPRTGPLPGCGAVHPWPDLRRAALRRTSGPPRSVSAIAPRARRWIFPRSSAGAAAASRSSHGSGGCVFLSPCLPAGVAAAICRPCPGGRLPGHRPAAGVNLRGIARRACRIAAGRQRAGCSGAPATERQSSQGCFQVRPAPPARCAAVPPRRPFTPIAVVCGASRHRGSPGRERWYGAYFRFPY